MKKQAKTIRIALPQRGDGVTTILKLKTHPTEDQIRQRAYEIHQARGGAPGQELDDWLQAERELKQECVATSAEARQGELQEEAKGGKEGCKEGDDDSKTTHARLGVLGASLLALIMFSGCASTSNEQPPTAADLLYQMNQQGPR